jgi:sterol desaturase/sphingolipid hydroxylase (fatty acid hydroxylase superfamily)
MNFLINLLLIQSFFLISVNLIGFACFEIIPIFLKKQHKISENFPDLMVYQFGMSILSLIFGLAIIFLFKVLKLDIGIINISQFPLFLQVFIIYLVSEFFIYLAHFGAHKWLVPLVSSAHRFHHRVTYNMEWVNSKKENPFIIFLFVLVFCIVFYIFFQTLALAKVLSVNIFIFLQALSHYREKISIPYLDKFFLFPSDHFRHHTERTGPYGVTLSIYDTIFGTRK